MKEFDTLVVITAQDFVRLKCQYERMIENLPSKKVIFLGSDAVKEELKKCSFSSKADFINENKVIPFDEVHSCMKEHMKELLKGRDLPRGITGWYYQQFLKMQYAISCNDEYYMTWDGDTIPCDEFSMFKDTGEAFMDLKMELHEEYFETMGILVPGLRKCISKSFISEHMLFRTDLMKALIDKINSNDKLSGSSFWEKIIHSIKAEKIQDGSFSEFETYGSFVCLNEPMAYRLRDWHSFRLAGEFFNPETISDRDYKWLSKDFFAISFEKNHFVRDDHKNLFDNPEYQNKLSPRQMLEIAQEEFQDGYLEKWDKINNTDNITNKKNMQDGGKLCPDDYEFMYYNNLGDYYENINPNKAYLAYEQACFICKNTEFKNAIKNKMLLLKKNKIVTVNKTAIVIVSYNSCYLMEKCLESIRNTTSFDMVDIIVVDNASTDGVREFLEKQTDIILIENKNNEGFPKGCNIGIEKAKNNQDIFLLNNDTRLTKNALFWLRMGLYESEAVGATGAVANYCGADQLIELNFLSIEEYEKFGADNNKAMNRPYEEKNRLCGFAMLLKREAFDKIGKLDEQFSPGYFEDDDISMGLHSLGYSLYVCHNAFIYHAGSQNFIKRHDLDEIMEKNHAYSSNKWGYDNLSYSVVTDREANCIKKINHGFDDSFNILEIGCGSGNFLTRIKYSYPNGNIYGIEKEEGAVWNGVKTVCILMLDWTKDRLPFPMEYFDYIIYNDRMGNGPDRERVTNTLSKYLNEQGKIIFS